MKDNTLRSIEAKLRREEQLDAIQREKRKVLLEEQYKRAYAIKEFTSIDWTFATKKLKGGSCILLAKPKYGYHKYREICRDGRGLKFKTKTSAHHAAEQICELGLTEAGFELGQEHSLL